MIRFVLVFLILGGAAVAAPKDAPNYDPRKQTPLPGGILSDQNAPPSDAEIALQMWRQHMGDTPMPEHLRRKYGIPDAPKNQLGQ